MWWIGGILLTLNIRKLLHICDNPPNLLSDFFFKNTRTNPTIVGSTLYTQRMNWKQSRVVEINGDSGFFHLFLNKERSFSDRRRDCHEALTYGYTASVCHKVHLIQQSNEASDLNPQLQRQNKLISTSLLKTVVGATTSANPPASCLTYSLLWKGKNKE